MGEPVYDEDLVNLEFLKKTVSTTEENIDNKYKDVSRNHSSKPQPPYNKGDTWIDANNIIYTCINSRNIGTYTDSDWTTESGAKEEAEKKNKTFLTQPINYNAGDMWILQTDTDHPSGTRGEILVTTIGRTGYQESDWVKKVSYGTVDYIDGIKEELSGEIDTITEKTVEISTNLGVVTQTVTETTSKVDTIEETLKYFSIDLDIYNITIPTDSNKKPLTSENYDVNFFGYYKGQQITPNVTINGSNTGITTSKTNTYVRFTVSNEIQIINALNDFIITFTYTADGKTYSLTKHINITLAISGAKGDIGPQGNLGTPGISTYFYVKYSANSNGNPMTTNPTTETQYMGVASTTSSTAPTSYSAYTWTKIKGQDGNQGIPGTPGSNGQTSYLHIKYSENGSTFTPADETYAEGEKPSAFIGQYVDFNQTDSTVFSDYSWYKFTENIDETLTDLQVSVGETATRLNNDYLTAEQIEADKQTIKDDINLIKQQTTTVTTTAEGLQVKIDKINNEGVKTVKNTTVDINEEGVKVGKADSEFSTIMNNTGTYMYAYDKQIAKYDKDGTETENFKATGEVEIGFLKMIKRTINNEKRTYIHWIGE